MRKDNVDLICSVGELAGLFEKSTSLENFLQTVVRIVAYHMRAAVCSVYLFDEETQELVLTANQGLDIKKAIRLKLGEGLTGTALKELRPIREGDAARNPRYKFIPGISEEKYRAFLAVPILRGIARVGVLVVQDPVENYFDENDTKALLAIAAQLATTIENAKLLIALHGKGDQTVETSSGKTALPVNLKFIKGQPGARGYAVGQPTIFGAGGDVFVLDDSTDAANGTEQDFLRALEKTEQQLEALQLSMQELLADVASMIFSAHLLMVKDPKFSGDMLERIRAGEPPSRAIHHVVRRYCDLFAASPNPRMREKVQDVKDLGHRLLQNLRTGTQKESDYQGHIVISGELLPSDILKLAAQKAAGLVQVGGAASSHVSILARSLNLPMVVADEPALFKLRQSQRILIDGDQGNIYVDPDDLVCRNFANMESSRLETEKLAEAMKEETWTGDGVRIHLMANINMLSETRTARRLKAEGIGLYRSEFPFIVRNNFPSEEEQYRVYRKIIDDMEGREILFRTLDVGGDKMLSYFPGAAESNPFLGLRAIRFSFRYQDIFFQQLRALLRAGAETPVKIMFPMVSSVDDFVRARDMVHACAGQLAAESIPHCRHPQLGAMIELPAAVEVADELAAEAAFISIGGNDLVQYMLAVDRTNQQISDLYMSHHPAVLRALKRIADAGIRHGKPVSLCGEMATDRKLLPFFIGIGLRRFSVEPRQIPSLHERIESLDAKSCAVLARQLLGLGRIHDVEQALKTHA